MLIVYAGLVGVIGILIINLAIAIFRSKFTPLLGIGNVEKLVFGIENIGYALVVVAALAIMQVNLDSLILGLAAQTPLSNIFGGISLILSKPFVVGDLVTISRW